MPTCFSDSSASKKKPHNLIGTLLMAKEADLFGLTTWFVQEIFHQCFWIFIFISLPFTTQKFLNLGIIPVGGIVYGDVFRSVCSPMAISLEMCVFRQI